MKRRIFIISVILFVLLVGVFGWRQGLHKLSLWRIFTAEFQNKQEKQVTKPQQSVGKSHNGGVNKQISSQKQVNEEAKRTEKKTVEGSQPFSFAPSKVQETSQAEPARLSQKGTTAPEYDSIKCGYFLLSTPDLNSRIKEITVEVHGWQLESVDELKTAGHRQWEPIENAEVEISVFDGTIVSTGTSSTKGKTDATGKFVTHSRSDGRTTQYFNFLRIDVKVPNWNAPIHCTDSPLPFPW